MLRKFCPWAVLFFTVTLVFAFAATSYNVESFQTKPSIPEGEPITLSVESSPYLNVNVKTTRVIFPINLRKFRFELKFIRMTVFIASYESKN